MTTQRNTRRLIRFPLPSIRGYATATTDADGARRRDDSIATGDEPATIPDNRELATLLWLSVFLCWALSKPELRSGLGGAFPSFFHPFICLSLLAMAGYLALEVWAGARLGIWDGELLKPTILWALLSGGVMFLECNKAARDSSFFRTVLAETVAIGVFVEFFMNVFVMSLLREDCRLPEGARRWSPHTLIWVVTEAPIIRLVRCETRMFVLR